MDLTPIVVLALIQGVAELLPVSSSAHVVLAARLMRLDPTAPAMTFLLVMLHTGTMLAVLTYFWKRWLAWARLGIGGRMAGALVVAIACTGALGIAAKLVIERVILARMLTPSTAEIEYLFGSLPVIAAALLAAGILIIVAGLATRPQDDPRPDRRSPALDLRTAAVIGLVQGVSLPFRGFSRSGATISAALLRRVPRALAEDFSFALAVLLTPPVIALELHRLLRASAGVNASTAGIGTLHLIAPALAGMVCSFGAGLLALRWLSRWLEQGRWHYFGYYCVALSAAVAAAWRWGL
jgi:undecaprenyl-diphosphatase